MKKLFRIFAGIFISLSVSLTHAQSVPLIIQTAPGGLNHKYALELELVLSQIVGAPIVIEFKPGGQGLVGAQALAQNKNTSLTLMLGAAQQEFAVDQLKDIVPVLDLGVAPTVLIARTSLGITSLSQLVKSSSNYTVGIPNGAAQLYWVREFSKNYTNLNLTEVPYKSGGAVLTDVAGGHVDIGIASAIGAAPLIQDGKVIVLATLSTKRSTLLPTTPTPREQGVRFHHDNTGFSHMFVWANPGASSEAIRQLKTGFNNWANSTEGQDTLKRIDLGTNLQTVSKPEIALREILYKK
jgi:tripartite-type tricarboxylate transporter receptor subunit TctC